MRSRSKSRAIGVSSDRPLYGGYYLISQAAFLSDNNKTSAGKMATTRLAVVRMTASSSPSTMD